MGIKIKNLQTGEFEKFNIPALKGEKGEPGEVEPSEKVDYIGKQHSKLRDTMNANVDYIIKTAIGEFNYLDYEGQHITATNSIEGHAKSAILKGQTLVNLMTNCKDEYVVRYHAIDNPHYTVANISMMKPNTEYTLFYKAKYRTEGDGSGIGGSLRIATSIEQGFINTAQSYTTEYKQYVYKITTSSVVDCFVFAATGKYFAIKECVLLEGDYTQEDIPFFEGMQSVKMPVLKTVGKNLFNMNRRYDNLTNSQATVVQDTNQITVSSAESGAYVNANFVLDKNFFKGKTVTGSCLCESDVKGIGTVQINYQDGNGNRYYQSIKTPKSFTFPNDFVGDILLCIYANNTSTPQSNTITVKNIQLELGSTATPYEPYKTNILTTPQDLELRGIGDVKDTLDCLTGEVVGRIGEIVLNGSENWTNQSVHDRTNTKRYTLSINDTNLSEIYSSTSVNVNLLSNFKANSPINRDTDIEGITMICWNKTTKDISIRVNKTTVNSLDEFKNWLSQNPITLQYHQASESIKTVDLSDNHVYSYKDTTHYACSSEDGSLVPTLSVKVPTDTQLTIQEQKATTQTLLIKNMDLQQSIKEVQAMNLAFNTALYNSFNSIREEVEDIKKHVSTNENLEGSF